MLERNISVKYYIMLVWNSVGFDIVREWFDIEVDIV